MTYDIQQAVALDDVVPESELETFAKAFEGQNAIKVRDEPTTYQSDSKKAGVICVFYICGLPFVRC